MQMRGPLRENTLKDTLEGGRGPFRENTLKDTLEYMEEERSFQGEYFEGHSGGGERSFQGEYSEGHSGVHGVIRRRREVLSGRIL